MPIRLLIGPPEADKTTTALQEFRQFTPLQQHESVRFVAPTLSQVLDLRKLVLSGDLPGILGDPFCTFQRLAGEITGTRPISETQKRLLIEQLPVPEYFRRTANLPAALSSILRTLKRSLISPGDLRTAAIHLPETSRPKASALAVIYQSYEDALTERNIQDSEGILIQALSRDVPWALVIVDGFTKLYPIHLEFIGHLADYCDVILASESLPPITQNLEPITLGSVDAIPSEIKKLAREGFLLDEIAVVARDIRPYQQKLTRLFAEYGIQLAVEVYPLGASRPIGTPGLPEERKYYAAQRATKRLMAEIEAAEKLFGRKLDPSALSEAINRATFRVSNGSGVTISDIDMLGGREFRALFVIEAPERQAYQDPFLLNFERELLNPHLPHALDLSTDVREATIPACERLYLCNAESDSDALPSIEDAETMNALRLRTILDCSSAEDEETKLTAAAAYNLLLEHGALGPEDFQPIPEIEELSE